MNILIHTEGFTNYYLSLIDSAWWLTFNTTTHVVRTNKLFGFIPIKSKKKFIDNVKVLELSPMIIFLLTHFITTVRIENSEKEDIPRYITLTEYDNNDFKKDFKSIVDGFNSNNTDIVYDVDFPLYPKNKIARSLSNEGAKFLGCVNHNTMNRSYISWDMTETGNYLIYKTDEIGVKGSDYAVTRAMNSFVFSRDLISKVLVEIGILDIMEELNND